MKKIAGVISKSLKEQLRSYWILLLTLSMGPFFIFVYFLITETTKPQYDIVLINKDQGILQKGKFQNYGRELTAYLQKSEQNQQIAPFSVIEGLNRNQGIKILQDKKADALLIIDSLFSNSLAAQKKNPSANSSKIELVGDLTEIGYLLSAVWVNEKISQFANCKIGSKKTVNIKETALGSSSSISEFDLMVPGLLIVSLIMLMFTAGIAFVAEVENKTMLRLKLSKITSLEFLTGITVVQLLIGIVSVLLTLATAVFLNFQYNGSLLIMFVIAVLTSLSIIAFSLIIAAFTKSANEVLVIGNFPMFIFMFFTGAAFPLKSDTLFEIGGYAINIQSFLSPTHAISALNKTLIMNMPLSAIMPEILAIITLTSIYGLIGTAVYKKRHLKLA